MALYLTVAGWEFVELSSQLVAATAAKYHQPGVAAGASRAPGSASAGRRGNKSASNLVRAFAIAALDRWNTSTAWLGDVTEGEAERMDPRAARCSGLPAGEACPQPSAEIAAAIGDLRGMSLTGRPPRRLDAGRAAGPTRAQHEARSALTRVAVCEIEVFLEELLPVA